MRTVTNAEFLQLMERSRLEWPPFQVGGFLYSRATDADVSQVGHEIVRTVNPT